MRFFREWLGRCSQLWLEGFNRRHGLAVQVPAENPEGVWQRAKRNGEQVLLHVGCGYATIEQIPLPGFHSPARRWREVRLDADERVAPDIVGTMTEMSAVPDGVVDAIFTSHGVEHLYWHDVPRALAEFRRVLADDGFVIVSCPDVQAAAQMISEDRMFETAYVSQAGPITPFDILYSYRPFVEANPEWMSHHCGFTLTTLRDVLLQAGFKSIYGFRVLNEFNLWVLASKSNHTADELALMASEYLPPAG